jgi:glycosyltransferase involved in cell wall biosynthesis
MEFTTPALTEQQPNDQPLPGASSKGARRLLFDVTGIVHWYAFFRHPSGIQRVSEKLISSLVLRQNHQVLFVARMLGGDFFYQIDSDLLADLDEPEFRQGAIARLRAVFAQSMRLAPIRSLLADARYYHIPYIILGQLHLDRLVEWFFAGRPSRALPPLAPVTRLDHRDVLFNPGDLWWQKDYVSVVLGLRARTGVRLVQMIHDLFVIERPEWFKADFARLFTSEFEKLSPHVDRWLTNSRFVTGQLRHYLEARSLTLPPIQILPMGWDSFTHLSADEASPDIKEKLKRYGLADHPFILFVGTVEPRKNLPTLLDALDGLRSRLGSRVPDLVVVGGRGWRSAKVRSRLRRDRHVHWFRAISDADLVVLYGAARFTVAPSHMEGWGLPVQESIAHGVPCIASTGGALPEAGADLVVTFEPADTEALTQAMGRWITDEAALAQAKANIVRRLAEVQRPTWNEAATVLLKHALS